MDILAICGSPRKNRTTQSVLQAVLEGTGRSYEILWPAFMKIGHCVGCLKCKDVTPGKCWQDDDMKMAIEKMFETKSLIIASPTYFGNVPGPLKNFIDRSIPTVYAGKGEVWQGAKDHGTRPFKGQSAIVLVVSGGGDHEKTAANIRLLLEYYEYQIVGEFVEGMGEVIVSKEEYPDIYNELFALGKKLDESLKKREE
ncbi:MAG: flavodoxin family protein [Deltaproteobacteria bacterium]|nr:flavodoxin family protein [Deltaproteobacteria bacterium]